MRDYYDEKSFSSIVDQMFGVYGKHLEAEYKMDEVGSKTYPDGGNVGDWLLIRNIVKLSGKVISDT